MKASSQTTTKRESTFLKTCLGLSLSIILMLQGFITAVGAIWFAYVFVQSQMLYLTNIIFLAIVGLNSFLPIFTALRIRKQKWFISLTIVAISWFVLSPISSFLINYTTDRMQILGRSMETELTAGNYVIIDNLAYNKKTPQRGDIVEISFPRVSTSVWIFRVIGLPGENVEVISGQIFIDGVALQESYTNSPAEYSGQWHVGSSEYFVLGDNRNMSYDSHIAGGVPLKYIIGKVTWIYLPISEAGEVVNYGYGP